MNTEEIKKILIENGGKIWEKGDHQRIYLDSNMQLEALGLKVVQFPKFSAETTGLGSKPKTYFDCKKEVFLVDTGSLKNSLHEAGFKAARIDFKKQN